MYLGYSFRRIVLYLDWNLPNNGKYFVYQCQNNELLMVHGYKCRLSVLLSHDFELANIDVNLKTVMAKGATHGSTYSIYLINGIFVVTLHSTCTRESPDPSFPVRDAESNLC